MPPVVEVQSPNHWTNREFPQIYTFTNDLEGNTPVNGGFHRHRGEAFGSSLQKLYFYTDSLLYN